MALLGSSGFESGVLATEFVGTPSAVVTLQGTTVHAGSFAAQFPSSGSGGASGNLMTGLNAGTLYARIFLRVSVSVNPSGTLTDVVWAVQLIDATAASGAAIGMAVTAAGQVSLHVTNMVGFAVLGSEVNINQNQWYLVEFKVVRAASPNGIIEWKLDGVLQATHTGLDTGATNLDRLGLGGMDTSAGAITSNIWYDDWALDNAGYPAAPSTDVPLQKVGQMTTAVWRAAYY